MSEPESAAPPHTPPASPSPKPRAKGPPVRFATVMHGLPSIALAAGFWMLIWHAVPAGNKELVGNVISGLLGYLTHAAVTKKAGAQ